MRRRLTVAETTLGEVAEWNLLGPLHPKTTLTDVLCRLIESKAKAQALLDSAGDAEVGCLQREISELAHLQKKVNALVARHGGDCPALGLAPRVLPPQ